MPRTTISSYTNETEFHLVIHVLFDILTSVHRVVEDNLFKRNSSDEYLTLIQDCITSSNLMVPHIYSVDFLLIIAIRIWTHIVPNRRFIDKISQCLFDVKLSPILLIFSIIIHLGYDSGGPNAISIAQMQTYNYGLYRFRI